MSTDFKFILFSQNLEVSIKNQFYPKLIDMYILKQEICISHRLAYNNWSDVW